MSQPPDQPKLNVDAELKILKASIVGRKRVQFDHLVNPTIKEFKKTVRYYKPHVIHFIGHATYQPDGKSGLIMVDENKESSTILSSDELAKILHWPGNQCRLVILNACETATVGANYQNSVAGALVRAGIPAVIGMQCKIPSNIALVFSESFYAYLLDGFCQPIDYALNNARAFIQRSKINQKLLAKYWCAPVLYSRSRDGLLFTLLERSDEVQEFNKIYKVVLSLGRLNEKSIQPVFEWLQSLGSRALPSLSLALTEGDPLTRQRAAIALGSLEDYFANELLENQLEFEKNDSVKQAIDRALEKANGSDSNDIDPPKAPRSYSGNSQSTHTELSKENSHSDTASNTKGSKPDLETILQRRENLINKFNETISNSESKIAKFKKALSDTDRGAKVYFGASKRVLKGIKQLERWSQFQSENEEKKRVTSERVNQECDQIQEYLNTWSYRGTLRQDIFKIENRLRNLEKYLESSNQRIDSIKLTLDKLESEHADSYSRKFYWTLEKKQRDIKASHLKQKGSRFKKKIKKLSNRLQENEEKVSTALKNIFGTEILTSDQVNITIIEETSDK